MHVGNLAALTNIGGRGGPGGISRGKLVVDFILGPPSELHEKLNMLSLVLTLLTLALCWLTMM